MTKKTEPIKPEYKCQFCEKLSPAEDWKDDECPHCHRKYDVMLAQEMDD